MRKSMLILSLIFSMVLLTVQPAYASGHGGGGDKKAEGEKKAEKKKGGAPSMLTQGPENSYYLKLDPMIMPVLGKNNVQEVVSMIVALQISEEKNVAQVAHLIPKIKDAYMNALYGNLNKATYRNGQFLDVTKLKNKLVLVTQGFADKKVIQDVLIQGISQRQFN